MCSRYRVFGKGIGRLLLGLLAAACAGQSWGAPGDKPQATGAKPQATGAKPLEEVIVTGERESSAQRTGQSSSSLVGEALLLQAASTLGETLAKQPGVHNASFGPGVGLPILRGLSGVRVRVMEDGIGSWDASAMSPDHANTVEAFLAERIEVLQGASAIEHGGAAIGGLVAVETRRMPHPDGTSATSARVAHRQELVNEHAQRALMGQLDWQSAHLGAHLDGLQRRQNNLSIPGCAIDNSAIMEQFGFDASASNTCGYTANSDAKAQGFAAGLGFNYEPVYGGLALRQLDNHYGIPPGGHSDPVDGNHNHAAGAEQDFVRQDMQQARYDLATGLVLDGAIWQSIDLTLARVDYQHRELEHQQVATVFDNQVLEGTLKLPHQWADGWQGSAGLHRVERAFAATGLENFVPPTDVTMNALYLVERLSLDDWDYQVGARWENTRIEQQAPTAPLGINRVQLMHQPIEYTTGNAQIAAEYPLTASHRLGLSLGYNQRAPDVQELLALGPHLSTRSYDLGALIRPEQGVFRVPKAETLHSIELSWHWQGRLGEQQLNLFQYQAADFIYQRNIGVFFDLAEQQLRNNCVRLEECLPVYEYTQADAQFTGAEWLWQLPSWHTRYGAWRLDMLADSVQGQLDTGAPLPRMPPWRGGLNLEWQRDAWGADLQAMYQGAQTRAGEFETTTPHSQQLDASLRYKHQTQSYQLTAFLRGKNLTDQTLRPATSFMRNFTPEAGRQLELGLRWDY